MQCTQFYIESFLIFEFYLYFAKIITKKTKKMKVLGIIDSFVDNILRSNYSGSGFQRISWWILKLCLIFMHIMPRDIIINSCNPVLKLRGSFILHCWSFWVPHGGTICTFSLVQISKILFSTNNPHIAFHVKCWHFAMPS